MHLKRSYNKLTIPGHNPKQSPCYTVFFAFTHQIYTIPSSTLVILRDGSVSSAMWDKNILFGWMVSFKSCGQQLDA